MKLEIIYVKRWKDRTHGPAGSKLPKGKYGMGMVTRIASPSKHLSTLAVLSTTVVDLGYGMKRAILNVQGNLK